MPDLTHHLQHHGGIEQHFDLRPGHPDGGETSSKQSVNSRFRNAGVIELPILGESNNRNYGNFDEISLYKNALFGLVI